MNILSKIGLKLTLSELIPSRVSSELQIPDGTTFDGISVENSGATF